MVWKQDWKWLAAFLAVFFLLYFLPVGLPRFDNAALTSLSLAKSYMREHVVLCLLPALLIAGAISAFISQSSIMRYFGAHAKKLVSYSVASVSGAILAVCSCTILPLFAGIYKRGAGLGPAIAFLYSGPAINILAIVLTARILGFEIGVARALGAIVFSVVIGLLMHVIFLKEKHPKAKHKEAQFELETARPFWQTVLLFASMCLVLIFANWNKGGEISGVFFAIHSIKWILTALSAAFFSIVLVIWFNGNVARIGLASAFTLLCVLLFRETPVIPFSAGFIGLIWAISTEEGEFNDWIEASWSLTKQIFPLLIAGILISGFLLGDTVHDGIIPSSWVSWAVGGNSFASNFISSLLGAFMYFATLTEVPILQGLMNNGMGKGPALALLLAGPALSLPSLLVLRNIMGTKKTIVYLALVVSLSTLTGIFYGAYFS